MDHIPSFNFEPEFKNTEEQERIINYQGDKLIVKAFAGTGKTTTLVGYAKQNPQLKMLYLAFNRSVSSEAQRKFPNNVTCMTSHALAFRIEGKKFNNIVNDITLFEIKNALNVKDWNFCKEVKKTLLSYLSSADKQISNKHVPYHFAQAPSETLTKQQKTALSRAVQGAHYLWQRMSNSDDPFPTTHDCYLKLYQLSCPDLQHTFDVILFDEAQDANPVTSSIVLSQQCKLILVGDPHQQIYRFRGADNALAHPLLENADVLYLTKSFRFGPQVANVANSILCFKDESRLVAGLGGIDDIVPTLPDNIAHKAVIHRTVTAVISTVFNRIIRQEPTSVFWVGGIDGYHLNQILDLYWFSKKEIDKIKNRKLISDYKTYTNYVEIAQATNDSEMLRAIKILQQYVDIPYFVSQAKNITVENELDANLTVSTAHRCKGLEWDFVKVYDDFGDLAASIRKFDRNYRTLTMLLLENCIEEDEQIFEKDHLRFRQKYSQKDLLVIDDELNLLYVAATRAMQLLEINGSIEHLCYYYQEMLEREAVFIDTDAVDATPLEIEHSM